MKSKWKKWNREAIDHTFKPNTEVEMCFMTMSPGWGARNAISWDREVKKGPSGCLVIVLLLVGIVILISVLDSDKKSERIRRASIAIVSVESANIRAGASTNHNIVDRASRGDTLLVLSKSNKWLLVKYKNSQGYIHEKLVHQYDY